MATNQNPAHKTEGYSTLKCQGVFYDIHGKKNWLLYVTFNFRGREYRWYPNWADFQELLDGALGIERTNNGRLKAYLYFSIINALHRSLLQDELQQHKQSIEVAKRTRINEDDYFATSQLREIHGYKPLEYE